VSIKECILNLGHGYSKREVAFPFYDLIMTIDACDPSNFLSSEELANYRIILRELFVCLQIDCFVDICFLRAGFVRKVVEKFA
jgi:hypothetical protein